MTLGAVPYSSLLSAPSVVHRPAEGDTGQIFAYGQEITSDSSLGLNIWGRPVVYRFVATCESETDPIFLGPMCVGVVAQSEEGKRILAENNDFLPVVTHPLPVSFDKGYLSNDELIFAPVADIVAHTILPQRIAAIICSRRDLGLRAAHCQSLVRTALFQQIVDQHMKRTFLKKVSSPVDPAVVSQANALLASWKTIPITKEQIDRFDAQRTAGSVTLKMNPSCFSRWKAADEYARGVAFSNEPITITTLQRINELVITGSISLGDHEWPLRDHAVHDREGFLFVGVQDVPELTDDLLCFVNEGLERIKRGEENPIVLAALAYQRAASIHAFPNGNGRTTRLLMDIILLRAGLLPAPLGEKVNAAIFGDQPKGKKTSSNTPTEVVQLVLHALQRAYLEK